MYSEDYKAFKSINAIILAAGKSSRFKLGSKILMNLCGKRIIDYVIDIVHDLNNLPVSEEDIGAINSDSEENVLNEKHDKHIQGDLDHNSGTKNHDVISNEKTTNLKSEVIVVVNDEFDKNELNGVSYCIQKKQLGTGHAVQSSLDLIDNFEPIVILLGDSPLVSHGDINKALHAMKNGNDVALGGFRKDLYSSLPNQYGRIIIEKGVVESIKEAKVFPKETEFFNAGWFVFRNKNIAERLLSKIQDTNGEYYLTECVEIANKIGLKVGMIETNFVTGINTLGEYSLAVESLQRKWKEEAIDRGVCFLDPSSVTLSFDTKIDTNVIIEPHVVLGTGVCIKKNARIKSFTVIENSTINESCTVGPFANLRAGTILMENSSVGSFVETKKCFLGKGSKAKHLCYLGDVKIEKNVNVGAGAVFCNYDGKDKHSSTVGESAFLGGNTTYVSPVSIGARSVIGAGSVITKDVSDGSTCVARAGQKELTKRK
ncbi:NTP transferase domain-containing protein [Candidatus Nesciobacter abundans]|uniref:NTP transferase domain-containing protein n=1 Tax=Candidatus Nesciobacter abundans TaxID=2601668 RepID=A0A5C0UK95_9PROT|nr:NTP transferase domain-containing protein [Candidatus Nesciobacter abundans]QEK39284.1 NTP transferase domain-containing protein [Candidatus Nesciobacter abundans]